METTIVLIFLATFVFAMILMHKFGGLCTASETLPTSDQACETPHAEEESYSSLTPQCLPQMKASRSHDDNSSPGSDYAISITDSTAEDPLDAPVVTRSTRVISFLRFSGYSQSDMSLADRSTSYSMWSSSCYSKGSECGQALEVDEAKVPPRKFTSKPRQVKEENDCVEIGELDGFAQRNLLSFKPQKPRGLTTKHIKKTLGEKYPPTHAYSL